MAFTIPQTMMVLSAVAYEQSSSIPTIVNLIDRNWQVTWGPVKDLEDKNLVYVTEISQGNYVVVIRGTDPDSPFSWLEDFDASLVDWDFMLSAHKVNGAEIAKGLQDGLDVINGFNYQNQTLLAYLSSFPQVENIYVTGHSLGGGLTPVVSAYINYWLYDSNNPINYNRIVPYSFAGQTPGNSQFATYIDNVFQNGAWRYYNSLDIVPRAYNNIEQAKDIYADIGGPKCPFEIAALIDLLHDRTKYDNYTQPNGPGFPLSGSLQPADDYVEEVGYQHSHDTYLKLMNAINLEELKQVKAKASID